MFQSTGCKICSDLSLWDDKSGGEERRGEPGQLNLYQYFTLIRGTRPRYQLRLYLLCGWISLLAVTLMGKTLSKQWGWGASIAGHNSHNDSLTGLDRPCSRAQFFWLNTPGDSIECWLCLGGYRLNKSFKTGCIYINTVNTATTERSLARPATKSSQPSQVSDFPWWDNEIIPIKIYQTGLLSHYKSLLPSLTKTGASVNSQWAAHLK